MTRKHRKVKNKKRSKQIKNKNGRKISFNKAMVKIRESLKKSKPSTLEGAISVALKAAKTLKPKIRATPRVIKIPKTGGFLPLIPLFAGLSALGAIASGASQVAKAVNSAAEAKKQLQESKRHNQVIETKLIGGKGAFLRPHRTGLGLFFPKSPGRKRFSR
nr:TPA_asm: pX [Bos-associated insect adintovirus 2]